MWFQLAFITAHFPAFIAEASSPIIQGSLISIICNSVASLGHYQLLNWTI